MNQWREGNFVRLLENGEEYFPRVFEVIGQARREVLIETFILFEDGVGAQLEAAVCAAAARGVKVQLTVDGYGSEPLSERFAAAMAKAGVELRIFDPAPKFFGARTNLFRRLHRKIVVVDEEVGFIGGINFADNQMAAYPEGPKQDFAVEVQGPVVQDLHRLVSDEASSAGHRFRGLLSLRRLTWRSKAVKSGVSSGSVRACLVTRDNRRHRDDIEREYRRAVQAARHRVIVANAYFFPSHRLLRDLRQAARRGVIVQLILQGKPDMPLMRALGMTLYGFLLDDGVEIYEYARRSMHGKIAVIDDQWATVGSSNLDPLSLSLNLEANLFLRDPDFSSQLRARMDRLIVQDCQRIQPARIRHRGRMWELLRFLAYHFSRHFPVLAGWLPVHRPSLEQRTLPP